MRLFLVTWVFLLAGSVELLAQKNAVQPKVLYHNLNKPTSIYATQNFLFVVESGKNRVLKLDFTGELLETLGGLGAGDYQFDTPIDIDATNGLKIYISDYRNNRIQVFDKRFQYLTTFKRYPWASSPRPIKPTHLSVNNFNELFFYDEDSNYIISIDDKGNKMDEFRLPGVIRQVDDLQLVGKNLYILDLKSKQYHVLTYNGVQVRSYPLGDAIQFYVDNKGEEWLCSSSSIRNSKESEKEIFLPQDYKIRDITKVNGVFYILTNKSVLSVPDN